MESNQNFTSNFEPGQAVRTIAYSPQAKLSPRYPTLSPLFALDSTLTVYEPLKSTTFTPQAKLSPNPTTSSIRLASEIGSPTPALSADTSFYDAPYNERFLISNNDETQREEKDICGSSYQIIHSNNFLSQPLFASPNPSLLSEAAGSPLGCSQRTHYLDPEEFFERHCAQKSIGTPFRTPGHHFPKDEDLPPFSSLVGNLEAQQADPPTLPSQPLNIVSLTIDGDNLETDALFTFDVSETPAELASDVPVLQEEHFEATALIRGSITPGARTKYPDKLEALQSMAKRKAAACKTKIPPRKDKTKQKSLSTSESGKGNVFFSNIDGANNAKDPSCAFGSVRLSEALGWCKCKYSRCLKVCGASMKLDYLARFRYSPYSALPFYLPLFFITLKLYCDCFRNGMICGAECKCKKCQNTEQGNSPGGAATQARDAILERRPDAFESRVVKVGEGCSCKKNRYVTRILHAV